VKKKISIIIPCYNEVDNLKKNIEIIKSNILKLTKYNFEIFFINDCSTDNIEEIYLKQKLNKNIFKLINLKRNIGKALALDIGANYSSGDILIILDGDLQYPTEEISKMLNLFIKRNLDVLNAKRIDREDGQLTRFFSNLYQFILSKLFITEKLDYFSGLKIFKREIYQNFEFRGMLRFLVFFSLKNKLKLLEYNVQHKKRYKGKTSYNRLELFILAIKDVISIIFYVILTSRTRYIFNQLFNLIFFLITLVLLIKFLQTKNNLYFNTNIFFFLIYYFFKKSITSYINYRDKTKNKEKNIIKDIL
jgi:glycosyltransferase involved in cell wall biosynthesis